MTRSDTPTVPDWAVEWLSAPRLGRYARAAGSACPLELYRHNCRLSSAAFELIGWFEIAWRNAIDRAILAHRPSEAPHWLFDRSFPLQPRTRAKVEKAIATVRASGVRRPIPDQVIAELTLGFWRFTTRGYATTIWAPYLSRAFPYAPRRPQPAEVDAMIRPITLLRNRIAHHEPIFERPGIIRDRVDDMLRIGGWINPAIAHWWRGNATISDVLAQQP